MAPIPPSAIARELREQITSGQLPQGSQLPAQRTLAERYGVSRDTVRAAVEQLVEEGLLELRRPVGTFVRERHMEPYWPGLRPASPDLGVWLGQLAASGGERESDSRVAVVGCPSPVAEHLACPEGAPVVHRSTVLYVDHEPHRLTDEYMPVGAFGGADLVPLHSPALDAWLAERRAATRVIDLWTGRMPTPDERRLLRMPAAGAPVLVHTRVEHEQGRPVRCVVTTLPADRHVVVYEQVTDGLDMA